MSLKPHTLRAMADELVKLARDPYYAPPEADSMTPAKYKQLAKDLVPVTIGAGIGYAGGKLLVNKGLPYLASMSPEMQKRVIMGIPAATTVAAAAVPYLSKVVTNRLWDRGVEAERKAQRVTDPKRLAAWEAKVRRDPSILDKAVSPGDAAAMGYPSDRYPRMGLHEYGQNVLAMVRGQEPTQESSPPHIVITNPRDIANARAVLDAAPNPLKRR